MGSVHIKPRFCMTDKYWTQKTCTKFKKSKNTNSRFGNNYTHAIVQLASPIPHHDEQNYF